GLGGVDADGDLLAGFDTGDPVRQAFVAANQDKIQRLVNASALHWPAEPTPGQLLGLVDSDAQVGITVPQQSLDALRERLQKDLAKVDKEIAGLAGRLANPNFAGKAPPEVVAECQANLLEAEAQAELVRGRLAELG
ncbi:MAG: valine--tRNA ligase, partial [Synechococcaceae cyanobacterium ELA182]